MRELECNRTLLTTPLISGADVSMPAFELQTTVFNIHRVDACDDAEISLLIYATVDTATAALLRRIVAVAPARKCCYAAVTIDSDNFVSISPTPIFPCCFSCPFSYRASILRSNID